MNIKKNIVLTVFFSLLLTAVFTSCVGQGTTDSTEAPTDAITEAPTEERESQGEWVTNEPVEVDCTITIMDQDGVPMPNLSVNLTPWSGHGETVTVTTDGSGKCTVTLVESDCVVGYDELPAGYLADTTSFRISKELTEYTLYVINNIPNGTAARPFVIVDETTSVSIPAGCSYVYMTYGGKDCSFTMRNTMVTVSYKDVDYTPDAEGTVTFPLISDGSRDPAYITLTNVSDSAVEGTFEIKPDPGTLNNPFKVETMGQNITATVPKENTRYYLLTADKDGVIMVYSETEKNHISMTNLRNSVTSYFTEGTVCEYIAASAGDEILIAVACSNSAVDSTDVVFSVTSYAGTAEDPIPICKEAVCFTHQEGESFTYRFVNITAETMVSMRIYPHSNVFTVTYKGEEFSSNADAEAFIFVTDVSEPVIMTVQNLGGTKGEFTIQTNEKEQND